MYLFIWEHFLKIVQISYQKIQIISELLGHVMLQLSRMLVCDVFVIFHVALFQL